MELLPLSDSNALDRDVERQEHYITLVIWVWLECRVCCGGAGLSWRQEGRGGVYVGPW